MRTFILLCIYLRVKKPCKFLPPASSSCLTVGSYAFDFAQGVAHDCTLALRQLAVGVYVCFAVLISASVLSVFVAFVQH